MMDTLPLDDQIAGSLRGVQGLRDEVARLSAQNQMLDRQVLTLESENATLRLQLESEKAERSYYHRFSAEVATSLNLIGQVCDDVMAKAQKEALRKDKERGELPNIEIPKFLLQKREFEKIEGEAA